jgi:mono/diheme cytochrome c family protein
MTLSKASWAVAAVLAVVFMLLTLDLAGVRAQLRDPPVGWDLWEPGWTPPDVWAPEPQDEGLRWRVTRHRAFLEDGVPMAYRGAHNPLAGSAEAVRAGGAIYAERCSPCHDPAGTGHGDAGLALYPSPALLAELVRMPDAVDEYLLWAISEGGAPFGTRMPAFKDVLTRDQIWQVIGYLRAGFPAVGRE